MAATVWLVICACQGPTTSGVPADTDDSNPRSAGDPGDGAPAGDAGQPHADAGDSANPGGDGGDAGMTGDPRIGDAVGAGDVFAIGDDLLANGDGGTAGDGSASTGGSLSICWTDASCPRVMAVGHGGLWTATGAPYDSDAALVAAYEGGMDGVKIDVRVTADNVPVIAHSSPIEAFESLDCYGDSIEQMTAAEVTACHRLPSLTETFQRLDDVLETLRGKMVAQLTVKRSVDYGRTIEEVHARGAEDFAFLEISTAELQNLIPTLPGSDTVYYLINVASTLSEIDLLLDTIKNPRAFMIEIDPTVAIGDLVATRLHPAGVRAFTYQSSQLATVAGLEALYDKGYDVVSANTGTRLVQARIAVNQARGVNPP